MGTAVNVIEDWASTDPEKVGLYVSSKGVILRWLNEAQLRYAVKSECLRDVWSPTITSTGNIALPTDFIREIKDRVKLNDSVVLTQLSFADARNFTFSGTNYYSINDGTFYVWTEAECTPTIPYIKKPTAITIATLPTADLEIPTESHHDLFLYFDSMFARIPRTSIGRDGNTVYRSDIAGSLELLKQFDSEAEDEKYQYLYSNEPTPTVRSGLF